MAFSQCFDIERLGRYVFTPNATLQARLEAGARHERTL
jgi:hypothetical protein